MPALPPYIPAKEKDFNDFLNNFSTLVSATPAAFGISTTDAATIAAQTAAWNHAYNPTLSPSTKTVQTVGAKNTAKIIVTAQTRVWAQSIANNPGVSIANKLALGLNPKTSTPEPITPPGTFPVLSLQGQTPRQVRLKYRDSSFSSNKAKPYGVTQCQVFGMPSPTPVVDQDLLPMIATPTKSPFVLNLPAPAVGQVFYVAARWALRTGEYGPWSQILSFTVTN